MPFFWPFCMTYGRALEKAEESSFAREGLLTKDKLKNIRRLKLNKRQMKNKNMGEGNLSQHPREVSTNQVCFQ